MNFRLLGTVDVEDDGRQVSLGGPKQRLVLAHLLLRANQVVPTDVLIEEIWGDEAPDSARSALYAYVSRLRRSLGPGRLEGRPPGYVLRAAPDEVDAVRFEGLVRQARDRLGRDPKTAAAILDEALSLWKGPPLSDLADEPSLRAEVARLEELRLAAAEDRIDAAFALGRTPDMAELEGLVERYPLRERFWGQLMVALYRSGRQAEALDAYRRARQLLSDELGIDPSQELQRLHEQILRQDPALQPEGTPLRGYRLLEKIGAGGFGEVHRGVQPQLSREVAVKVIHHAFVNDPEFVRRFETEAQLVARLEHPRIVPLYDYWRDPGGAYLVMRYLRGGSLRQRLAGGPLEPQDALRVVEQVAEALDTAHRAEVVHRDVKPENVLFDEVGNAYLTDFGVAKELSAPGMTDVGTLLGTPAYVAPELIRGEPVTPASDIYSLGLMLFETLTGQAPFPAELEAAQLYMHLEEPTPSVLAVRPELPAAVDEVIARATSKQSAARYPDAPALAVAFRDALGGAVIRSRPAMAPAEARNPYKGLRPFLETDATDFFGREALVDQLVARMAEAETGSRFLAVVGPSGSGKSSAVRAGLIPALRHGGVPGSDRWFVVEMVPGAYPFEELEAALLKVAVNPPASLLEQLERDEHGLLRAVKRSLPADDTELLLVIDQFEELFTLVEDEERRARFLGMLAAAVEDPHSRIRVVVTLRADFYDRPLTYSGFGELLASRTQAVIALSSAEMERAISAPAERMGVDLEPQLVGELVAEALDRPAALPLLQYALTELFDARERGVIPAAANREIGGVSGALVRRAEELYEASSPPERVAARQLFLRLVTVGEEGTEDTRRRVSLAELTSLEVGRDAMAAVIDVYGAHRLLSFDRDPVTRGPTVEVAHEALLRQWTRLRGWIEGAREDVRMHRRLGAAAAEWVREGEDPSFLPAGARLGQLESWASSTDVALSELDRRYLSTGTARRDAEEAEAERRKVREAELEHRSLIRLRALIAILTVAALVATALSAVAVSQRRNAQRSAVEARAQSRRARTAATAADAQRLGAQALVQKDLGFSLLLAREGVNLDDSTATEGNLLAALLRSPAAIHVWRPLSGRPQWVQASPDGSLLAVGNNNGQVGLVDPRTGRAAAVFKGVWGYFSDDSRTFADFVQNSDGTSQIRLLDSRSGSVETRFDVPSTAVDWTVPGDMHTIVVAPQGGGSLQYFDSSTHRVVQQVPAPAGTEIISLFHVGSGAFATVDHIGPLPASFGDVFSQPAEVSLWSDGARKPTASIRQPSPPPCCTISPDHRTLAVPGGGTITLYDLETGRVVRQLRLPPNADVSALAFSPDGRVLVSGGDDNTAIVWDVESGHISETLVGHNGPVHGVAFGADAGTVYTSSLDGTVMAWDLEGTRRLGRPFTAARASTDSLGAVDAALNFAQSPDGTLLALAQDDTTVTIMVARTLQVSRHLQAVSGGKAITLAFSPDGRELAVGGFAEVSVWDTSTWSRLADLTGFPKTSRGSPDVIRALAFSPDGRTLAAGDSAGAISFFDPPSGSQVGASLDAVSCADVPPNASCGVYALAYSPDGTRLAAAFNGPKDGSKGAQYGGWTAVWSVPGGSLRYVVDVDSGYGHADAVAFSPDGLLLLTGGGTGEVGFWDAATGAASGRPVLADAGWVQSISYDAPGHRILAAGTDGTTRLYDAATRAEIGAPFPGNNQGVVAAFTPEGTHAVVVAINGQAWLWDVRPSAWEAHACSVAGRQLTRDEWDQFLPDRRYRPVCPT